MDLRQQFLTANKCYIVGAKMAPCGIMVHSTGANNNTLKRYVQPDDGLLGVNKNGNHWNQYTPGGKSVCVHAFIGLDKNGDIATYQTLPWDFVGWHSGKGKRGSANYLGYIGFEICEDNLTNSAYFSGVYREAVELCAYLCKLYKLDPMEDGVIICHSEGYSRGIASNHADVMHWFSRYGVTMDQFRRAVYVELTKDEEEKKEMRYNKISEMPEYAQATIAALVDAGKIGGTGTGAKDENGRPADLDLSNDMIRLLVILGR